MVYILLIAITIGVILYLLNSSVQAEKRNTPNQFTYYQEEFSEEDALNDLNDENEDKEGKA